MQSRLTTISLLLFLCCGPSLVFGQKTAKKDGKGLAAWDANQDGLLQREEIPPKLRPQVLRWAESLDLDTKKPLPIKKLIKSKEPGDKKKKLSDEEKAAKKLERKKIRVEAEETERKTAEKAGNAKRRVAGFGKDNRGKDDADDRSGDGKSQGKSDDESKKDDKESASERRRKRRYGMLAKSLLFQNDKNQNGRLERNEWRNLKGDPARADENKDGVLTQDELAVLLQGFGSRERDVTRRAPSRSNRARKDKNGKSFRFLTPHERLPEGLPGWFTERDYNVDGQISLDEYEAELTAAKVAKFRQFDLNGDGFLVAKEYLKATN